jgi:uncharacterized protein YciI
MKRIVTCLSIFCCGLSAPAQSTNPQYDSALAKKLGADEYGMKPYFFVILKTGPNKTKEKKYIDSCFAGHFANMGKMEAAGQLIVAGPFGKNNQQMRGLFILNAASLAEAERLVQGDPAVNGRLLRAEVYPWYGSAALPEYLKTVDKVWVRKPG